MLLGQKKKKSCSTQELGIEPAQPYPIWNTVKGNRIGGARLDGGVKQSFCPYRQRA